jgi:hypothetical protein
MAADKEQYGWEAVFDIKRAEQNIGRLMKHFERLDRSQNQINKSGGRMGGTFQAMGQAGGAIKQAATSMAGMAAGMFAFQSISSVFSTLSAQVPAVSMAFQNAGRVIQANLIWPIMKDLLPLLQKLTKWVRENRLNFARFGVFLKNVFRTVGAVIKGVFKGIQTFTDAFFKSIGAGRLTFQRFIDFMQLMLLKVAVFFITLQMLMQPAIESIGRLLGAIWKNAVMPFVSGFVGAFLDKVLPVFGKLKNLIIDVGNTFTGVFGEDMAPVLRNIGTLLGTVIGGAISRIIDVLEMLWTGIIKPLFQGIAEGFGDGSKSGEEFTEMLIMLFNAGGKVFKFLVGAVKATAPVWRFVGKLIGLTIGAAFKAIVWVVKGLIATWELFTETIPKQVEEAMRKAGEFIDGFKKRGADILGAVGDVVSSAWEGARKGFFTFVNLVRGYISQIERMINRIPGNIENLFKDLSTKFKEFPFVKFFMELKFGEKFGQFMKFLSDSVKKATGDKPKVKGDIESPSLAPEIQPANREGRALVMYDNSTYNVTVPDAGNPRETAKEVISQIESRREGLARQIYMRNLQVGTLGG